MNRHEVKRVLAFAATIDQKIPGPDPVVIDGWTAMTGDIPLDAAMRATHAYYRSERYHTTREPITPADLVQWWRAVRARESDERTRAAIAASPARSPEEVRAGVARVTAALAVARGLDEDAAACEAEARRAVMAVPCPWEACRAGVNEVCRGCGGSR